jgi:hypothetical protein
MKINSIAQSSFAALLLMFVPAAGFAATPTEGPFCIAVNGGFGHSGGSTYVARNFTMPDANKCTSWAGYTKTASTVVLTTTGTACVSSDNKALTVAVSSADPDYLGVGQTANDYIGMTRTSTSQPFSGSDAGYLMGAADQVSCTSGLLTLPAIHD